MNKVKIIQVCNIVAFIMALSFVLKVARDAFVYTTTLNSAPFYIWIIVDAVYYLLPGAVVFLVGCLVKRRLKQEQREKEE